MKEKLKQLKNFNWRLFASLCALALIPAVYQTVRTFIISSNGESGVFDVIGQMEWFDLIDETLRAFLIIPLYSVLNKLLKHDEENFAKHTFKVSVIAFALYTLFSVGVLIYGSVLVAAMNPAEVDLAVVNHYLQLETVAFMVGILPNFFNVVFVVVGKDKNVYIFLGVKTVLSVVADFLLIPAMGVYGIAVSNIIVNALLAVASFLVLFLQKLIRPAWYHKSDLQTFKEWGKVGIFSGAQQFIDNLIYAVMIGKMVNMVAEQGNYWIANNFIWGWMLIPITALSEVIRHCRNVGCLYIIHGYGSSGRGGAIRDKARQWLNAHYHTEPEHQNNNVHCKSDCARQIENKENAVVLCVINGEDFNIFNFKALELKNTYKELEPLLKVCNHGVTIVEL